MLKKILKAFLKLLFGFLLVLPFVLVLLVRFTDGTIKAGEKILMGYDEDKADFQFWEYPKYELAPNDGPVVMNDSVFSVSASGELQMKPLDSARSIKVMYGPKDFFSVKLNSFNPVPASSYPAPARLLALSDIEGNFQSFYGFLQRNGVIDENLNWTFGESHLVLVGDFVDRGNQVLPVLWLIYKLETEAEKAGGRVHFILGNHEIMNMQGNWKYAVGSMKKLALDIGGLADRRENYKLLFSERAELGRWLRSKNVVEKIGPNLLLHAGFSPDILGQPLTLENINEVVRQNLDSEFYHSPGSDSVANLLVGRKGPFWYRGLVQDYKYYDRALPAQVKDVLTYYDARRMIIGHTVVDAVSTDYDGAVVRIDVKHGTEKFSMHTQGLLIEDGRLYVVDGDGGKDQLH